MYSDDHCDSTAACVEFTFRVHSDGRRERLATVLVRDSDGIYRPGPRRPTGDLAGFVAKAVGEAMEELSPRKRVNRRDAVSAPGASPSRPWRWWRLGWPSGGGQPPPPSDIAAPAASLIGRPNRAHAVHHLVGW